MKIFQVALGTIVVSMTLGGRVYAELITFEFTGTVTEVIDRTPDRVGGPFKDWPEIGAPITGRYTFDSTANGDRTYFTRLEDRAIVVEIGEFEWAGSEVVIGATSGRYEVGQGASHVNPFRLTSHPERNQLLDRMGFRLSIFEEGLLEGTELPLTPPVFEDPDAFVRVLMDSSLNFQPPYVVINSSLETLTLVPEPAAASLAAILPLYLHHFFRRRKGRDARKDLQ